jgi:hypothetical protein
MPVQISTSLTMASTRAYAYRPDAEYVIDESGDGDDVLYTLDLVLRETR